MKRLSVLKAQILDLLFPLQCCGCGKTGVILCALCAGALTRIPPQCFVCRAWVPGTNMIPAGRTCLGCRPRSSIYAFLSPFSYQQDIVRELIHSLKYQRNRNIAPVLADMMALYLVAMRVVFPQNAVLMPIPLHKTRERTRGFNQSLLIAMALGERLMTKVEGGVLRKTKKTTPQMELRREERLRNLADSFMVISPPLVKGKLIVLVDDVRTTGATLEEAARVLKQAGAKRIWAITIAH
ncbi:MAG: ComF family protein [Candidatus Sungbacteria bacterium]|nr:ComF family protein [Candidatus Sungbacteria bacterium]